MKFGGSLDAFNIAKDLTETEMENVEAADEEADEVPPRQGTRIEQAFLSTVLPASSLQYFNVFEAV